MKRKCRGLLGLLSLLFSGLSFAGSMGEQQALPYDGLYVGGDVGVSNLTDRQSTSPSSPATHQLGATGAVGGGVVGYDYRWSDNLNLGVEWFMNGTGLNVAAEQFYAAFPAYTANMRYDLGVRVLPGYELSPGTVGHVLLGYANGKFHIQDNGDFGVVNQSFSKSGFQSGLGIRTPILGGLSIRGDLLYTIYASQTTAGVTTSSPATVQNYQNSFATLEGNLTLLYKFSL